MSWFTSVNYFLKSGITMTVIIRNKLHTNFRLYSTVRVAQSDFVPPHDPVKKDDITLFQRFINDSKKLLVITGAGISTESGIPDYRSEGVGLYARGTDERLEYEDFLKRADIRHRYWTRDFVNWPTFSVVLPNENHSVLSSWEKKGKVHWLVTQNIDGLHRKAGSKNLSELHGNVHRVECVNCDHRLSRTDLQEIIQHQNPNWHSQSVDMAPDGDAQLSEQQIQGFKVPSCEKCGCIMKPKIIFFGETIPLLKVNLIFEKVKECDSLLVLGSSLEIYSGYRFVSAAYAQKKQIAIVNIGKTRADNLATIKISGKCSDVLKSIQLT